MWDGSCTGYEGLLVDNNYALLAVLDREVALKRKMRFRFYLHRQACDVAYRVGHGRSYDSQLPFVDPR